MIPSRRLVVTGSLVGHIPLLECIGRLTGPYPTVSVVSEPLGRGAASNGPQRTDWIPQHSALEALTPAGAGRFIERARPVRRRDERRRTSTSSERERPGTGERGLELDRLAAARSTRTSAATRVEAGLQR
jgi:hypothetical protein